MTETTTTPEPICPSKIETLLNSEKEHWDSEYEKEEDYRKKLVIHGAVCELLFLIEHAEKVTREWLLSRYKEIKNRKHKTKLYAYANASKSRDELRIQAITRIGKKINEIQN